MRRRGFCRMAEAGVDVAVAQSPFLGAEHHRAQDLQGAVGHAGSVPAGGIKPRGNILRADPVERHATEPRQHEYLTENSLVANSPTSMDKVRLNAGNAL